MMNKVIFFIVFTVSPFAGAAAGTHSQHGNVLMLAEADVHSTAGIANRVHRRFEAFEADELMPDENAPDFADEATQEQLDNPVSEEKISPTRSQVVTRTTSRPSSRQSSAGDLPIAPVIVPIDPHNHGYYPESQESYGVAPVSPRLHKTE